MAAAKTVKFGSQILVIGNGATPEVFTSPCGLTSLNLDFNIETNDTNAPDCTNPDLPSWLITDVVSQQMVISGEGILDTDALQVWNAWILSGGEKNIRWIIAGTGANGGGYWSAPGILSTFGLSGERGSRWQQSIEIRLNGQPTFTKNA